MLRMHSLQDQGASNNDRTTIVEQQHSISHSVSSTIKKNQKVQPTSADRSRKKQKIEPLSSTSHTSSAITASAHTIASNTTVSAKAHDPDAVDLEIFEYVDSLDEVEDVVVKNAQRHDDNGLDNATLYDLTNPDDSARTRNPSVEGRAFNTNIESDMQDGLNDDHGVNDHVDITQGIPEYDNDCEGSAGMNGHDVDEDEGNSMQYDNDKGVDTPAVGNLEELVDDFYSKDNRHQHIPGPSYQLDPVDSEWHQVTETEKHPTHCESYMSNDSRSKELQSRFTQDTKDLESDDREVKVTNLVNNLITNNAINNLYVNEHKYFNPEVSGDATSINSIDATPSRPCPRLNLVDLPPVWEEDSPSIYHMTQPTSQFDSNNTRHDTTNERDSTQFPSESWESLDPIYDASLMALTAPLQSTRIGAIESACTKSIWNPRFVISYLRSSWWVARVTRLFERRQGVKRVLF
ncbi:hypothetical protein HDU76_007412 [Blyttiomyces sp. JEL0837]|nr:hypothetical protein HDU76_007412 [Blyttiomyces sp. JEL0837]